VFLKRKDKIKSKDSQKGRIRKAKKRPFYKRFWFWLLLVILVGGGVGSKIVWDKNGQQAK